MGSYRSVYSNGRIHADCMQGHENQIGKIRYETPSEKEHRTYGPILPLLAGYPPPRDNDQHASVPYRLLFTSSAGCRRCSPSFPCPGPQAKAHILPLYSTTTTTRHTVNCFPKSAIASLNMVMSAVLPRNTWWAIRAPSRVISNPIISCTRSGRLSRPYPRSARPSGPRPQSRRW